MSDETHESYPPSPTRGVLALVTQDTEWQPVFHVSNQVVLYNPTSHALSIRQSDRLRHPCPYCKQLLPPSFQAPELAADDVLDSLDSGDPAYHSRASDYFQLLAVANESSRPSTPPTIAGTSQGQRSAFPAEAMAEGYFKAFFQEEYKLGMGANGSVYLCQHMLDGNPLGHFAVKKIAVGESHSYLLKILREVRLLESLHHPNIITYHHAWLESAQFSAFGPKVPTLHVLMQWAEGGSLDDFIDIRLGRGTRHIHVDPLAPFALSSSPTHFSAPPLPSPQNEDGGSIGMGGDIHSRSARIRAFRAFQRAAPDERERMRNEMKQRGQTWKAVHLLSAEEVKSLFRDVVEGLAFLHSRSILHLDLKPGNVLLTWDEGKLIPRAMLSDFGTSRDMIHNSRARSGNTGTLEYTSPESLPSPLTGHLQQIDSKSDMWSLGMILHKLLFFSLPYRYASDGDRNPSEDCDSNSEEDKLNKLEKEVLGYSGFKSNPTLVKQFTARRLPRAFLVLLEGLLNVVPAGRSSSERVAMAIREGRLDPLEKEDLGRRNDVVASSSLVARRISDPPIDSGVYVRGKQDGDGKEKENGQITPTLEEKTHLLGYPMLSMPEGTDPGDSSGDGGGGGDGDEARELMWWDVGNVSQVMGEMPGVMRRVMWRRAVKSCVLVAKVWTITSMYPFSRGRLNLALAAVLLFMAVLDTLLDSLRVSIVLLVFHVGVVLRWYA